MRAAIPYNQDPALVVYVDFDDKTAGVTYCYDIDERFDPEDIQTTPFQSADLPIGEQAAAAYISDWLESMNPDRVRLTHDDGRQVTIDINDLDVRVEPMSASGFPHYEGDKSWQVTVKCDTVDGEQVTLLAGYGLPEDAHGPYLEWLAMTGWHCADDAVAAKLERAIQRRVP